VIPWFKPKTFFEIEEIDFRKAGSEERAMTLRAAAGLVERALGKQKSVVTPSDLDHVRYLIDDYDVIVEQASRDYKGDRYGYSNAIAQSELKRRLSVPEIEQILRPHIDDLKEFFHPRGTPDLGPAVTQISPDAIGVASLREMAKTIIQCFDPSAKELNLGQLMATLKVVDDKSHKKADPEGFPGLAAKLEEQIKAGTITRAGVHALNTFMISGLGGLENFGPISIKGKPYHRVYRLPCDPAMFRDLTNCDFEPTVVESFFQKALGDEGDKDRGGKSSPLKDTIANYEKQFSDTRVDRIYVAGYDGGLYLAINPKGRLRNVSSNYRASMRRDKKLRDSGVVIHAVDVENSLPEALGSFWGGLFARIKGAIKKMLPGRIGHGIEEAGEGVEKALASAAEKSAGVNVSEAAQKMLGMSALLSAVGYVGSKVPVLIQNIWPICGLLGLAGVAITAVGLIDYLTHPRDLTPILMAAGITVNRPGPLTTA
jgi:hypothetical protein